jgi:acetyl esterase/lipase
MVGSSDVVPKPQVQYLCDKGFAVVLPNYRLVPQVTGKQSFTDCETAYDWAVSKLPKLLKANHGVILDVDNVVAMGHSSGGTLSMHIAGCRPLKAATAFYPSLYGADTTTSIHKPTTAPPFGFMPDWTPTKEDLAAIEPAGKQVSEFQLGGPHVVPQPRNKWQMMVIKHGEWAKVVQPDGDLAALDPLTRISAKWAPLMIVQGAADNVPGSNLELALKAEKDLKSNHVNIQLEVVPGEGHMFDIMPAVGTSDLGIKWQAVVKGLDWLLSHVVVT